MNGTCAVCGLIRLVHRDHIVPRSLGGSDEDANIQYLCANCHEDKTTIDRKVIFASPEVRARMSNAHKGKPTHAWTAEGREKISQLKRGNKYFLGHSHTDESKAKMRAARLGTTHSPETKARLSEMARGRRQRPESIAKMILANTGKKRSAETCRKIGDSKRGKPLSLEHRMRLSAAHQSPQYRAACAAQRLTKTSKGD